jgi:hypothetical protein
VGTGDILVVSILVSLLAQAVTTATIRGTVDPGDARVRVINDATGFVVETEARQGHFTVHGLEVGGPYRVVIRRIGFQPTERTGLTLALGRPLELHVRLSGAGVLDTVRVSSSERHRESGTTISDSALRRLPSLNRDMYDFVRLAPQISTKVGIPTGGISSSGVNPRFNNYLTDGAPDRFPTGNSATTFGGGRSVPLDAVKEFQVLTSPFDVRYGDFAGALINTVTKTGTNELHASAFADRRSNELARASAARGVPYERTHVGLSVSGPLIRDRMHFLLSPELQRLTSPARGPLLGEGSSASAPVTAADVTRLSNLLRGYGLDAGSGGPVSTGNRSASLFERLDLGLGRVNTRVVLLDNYQRTDNIQFSRSATDTFQLSSYRLTIAFATHLTSGQLHTNVGGRGYNALTLSRRSVWSENRPDVRAPLVQVAVPSTGGGTAILKTGSQESANGVFTASQSFSLTDQFVLPIGASHEILVGAESELFRLERGGLGGSYGAWTFSSLDSLEGGLAERYQVRTNARSAEMPMRGAQAALYVGDEWRANDRVRLTFGLRADVLALLDHGPYNAEVDSVFGRRTDRMPPARVHLSPRIGFVWELEDTGRDEIRGGGGIFTGRYPPAFAYAAVYSYGSGAALLSCGTLPNDLGPAPAFVPDYHTPPTLCANGKSASVPRGDVDVLDRHLRMAQSARASLAYARRLPWGVTATVEGMLTRNLSDVLFENLNLRGPQGFDRNGRVMYGTVLATGVSAPALISGFTEVIDLRNVSANHAVQIDGELEKQFSRRIGAFASYTFTRVRDVQLPLRAGAGAGIANWSTGRVVSARHDDLSAGISGNDLPHRVVFAGAYRAPWRPWSTDVSVYYVGESGAPFTYVTGGLGRRGDLNADGSVGNDPIYVPTNTRDTSQIQFSGVSDSPGADNSPAAQSGRIADQQRTLEELIDRTHCLQRQRGHIMRRNSCREPWSSTSVVSVRQAVPVWRARGLALHMDVFNVLNLLNAGWGQYKVASAPSALLSQVGETAGPSNIAQPIFRFDTAASRWVTLPAESSYQIQFALRYTF